MGQADRMMRGALPLAASAIAATAAVCLAMCRRVQASVGEWVRVELPQQALWNGIPNYFRHRTLPVLSFATEMAGLGDPATMAAIQAGFQPRPTDVHIVTYPKAGTSWTQEVAWLVNHQADIETANRLSSGQRTVYIELSSPK